MLGVLVAKNFHLKMMGHIRKVGVWDTATHQKGNYETILKYRNLCSSLNNFLREKFISSAFIKLQP